MALIFAPEPLHQQLTLKGNLVEKFGGLQFARMSVHCFSHLAYRHGIYYRRYI